MGYLMLKLSLYSKGTVVGIIYRIDVGLHFDQMY